MTKLSENAKPNLPSVKRGTMKARLKRFAKRSIIWLNAKRFAPLTFSSDPPFL